MDRSLMQLGIAELESLFSKSKADTVVLKQLDQELQHRKTQRAVALLADVRKCLSADVRDVSARPVEPAATATPMRQLEFDQQPVVAPTFLPADRPKPIPTRAASVAASTTLVPSIGAEEACRILRVTLGSPWEVIEKSRRDLVQQAYPASLVSMSAERRGKELDAAKRANAAYAVLSAVRCGKSPV